jgi:hypothetical protein
MIAGFAQNCLISPLDMIIQSRTCLEFQGRSSVNPMPASVTFHSMPPNDFISSVFAYYILLHHISMFVDVHDVLLAAIPSAT